MQAHISSYTPCTIKKIFLIVLLLTIINNTVCEKVKQDKGLESDNVI